MRGSIHRSPPPSKGPFIHRRQKLHVGSSSSSACRQRQNDPPPRHTFPSPLLVLKTVRRTAFACSLRSFPPSFLLPAEFLAAIVQLGSGGSGSYLVFKLGGTAAHSGSHALSCLPSAHLSDMVVHGDRDRKCSSITRAYGQKSVPFLVTESLLTCVSRPTYPGLG